MLHRRKATVLTILAERPGCVEILVDVDGAQEQAVYYPDLTGIVTPGDEVLINTTAVDLGLGTGGVHFVIANLSRPVSEDVPSAGHIMKLRYTPVQEAVLSVEEEASPHRSAIREFQNLDGMPVICCELHSQIAPAAAALKALTDGKVRVAYIMTDGAALPIGFSRLVFELLEKGLLDQTITCGQAVGGGIEAVNLYTALVAAKEVAGADAVIVCQGPGNAGTGTKYGFSGIQQGEAINAANILGGAAIAVLRISFADARERHRGISHHTLTVLSEIALSPALIAVPKLPEDRAALVREQLDSIAAKGLHQICMVDGEPGLAELSRRAIDVRTMGRTIDQDREFFLAASAAGSLASEILSRGISSAEREA